MKGSQSAQMSQNLSLVIGGSPTVKIAVFEGGLEGRMLPGGFLFSRLDIVVTVNEQMRQTLTKSVMSDHSGMPSRFSNLGSQSGSHSLLPDPLTSTTNVCLVLGVGGDAWYGHKFLESLQVSLKLFVQSV